MQKQGHVFSFLCLLVFFRLSWLALFGWVFSFFLSFPPPARTLLIPCCLIKSCVWLPPPPITLAVCFWSVVCYLSALIYIQEQHMCVHMCVWKEWGRRGREIGREGDRDRDIERVSLSHQYLEQFSSPFTLNKLSHNIRHSLAASSFKSVFIL